MEKFNEDKELNETAHLANVKPNSLYVLQLGQL